MANPREEIRRAESVAEAPPWCEECSTVKGPCVRCSECIAYARAQRRKAEQSDGGEDPRYLPGGNEGDCRGLAT